jgi:ATP-dependent DNA ligase
MLDDSKFTKKVGYYHLASSGGVTDRVLLDVAVQYGTQVSPKTVSYTPDEMEKRLTGAEKVMASIKYDGEGVFFYYEAGKPVEAFAFAAPSGRSRYGLACLEDLAAKLKRSGIKKALLRGELYLDYRVEGKRAGVHEVLRTSHSTSAEEVAAFKCALYDIIMWEGKDLRGSKDFMEVWKLLEDHLGTDTTQPCHCAKGMLLAETEVPSFYEAALKDGYEGIVVRRLARLELIKIKPRLSVDGAVIGFVEGEFEGHYGITSLLIGLNYPGDPSHWQVIARVGSGFSDEMRQELLQVLRPLKVDAPLAMTDSDGRTIHFVKPQLMAEITGHDVVTASRQDKENTTQLLSWSSGQWSFRGMTACPRILFPIFTRLRADKEISSGGARMNQLVANANAAPRVQPPADRETKVVRREVWTKESKGETMVRKLVVFRNEGDSEAFPWVLCWTDFSAKRKEPLKIDTSYANTEARAKLLAEQMIAEGITKGWVKKEA